MIRWLVLMAACGAPPVPAPPIAEPVPAYVAADQRLAERCHGGCDEAACHEQLVLELHERGFVDAATTLALAAAQCDRGDKLGCVFAAVVGVRPWASVGPLGALTGECIEQHHRRACEVALALNGVGTSMGRSHHHPAVNLETEACQIGIMDACYAIAARGKVIDPKVPDACDAHDPDACAALGKPFDPRTQCEAGDLIACDDAKQDEVLCRHGFCGSKLRVRDLYAHPPNLVATMPASCR